MCRKGSKPWHDLTTTQRTRIVVTGCLQLALLAAALTDIRRRPASEIKGSKRL
jgi:hypothetical protein